MSRIRLVGMTILLLASAPAGAANNAAMVRIGAYDFSADLVRTLYDLGQEGSIEYRRLLQDNVAVGLEGSYAQAAAADVDGHLEIYSLAVTGTYFLAPQRPFDPYFKTGLGYAIVNADPAEETGNNNRAIMYVFAAGWTYTVRNRLELSFETAYRTSHMEDALNIGDLNLGGIVTTLGAGIRF